MDKATRMTDEHIGRCIARLDAESAGRPREGRELAAALRAALARRAEAK